MFKIRLKYQIEGFLIIFFIIEKNAIEKFVKDSFIKVYLCLGLNILSTSVKQDFMKGLNS